MSVADIKTPRQLNFLFLLPVMGFTQTVIQRANYEILTYLSTKSISDDVGILTFSNAWALIPVPRAWQYSAG